MRTYLRVDISTHALMFMRTCRIEGLTKSSENGETHTRTAQPADIKGNISIAFANH